MCYWTDWCVVLVRLIYYTGLFHIPFRKEA